MTLRDKALFHQIHPSKLLIDIFSAFVSLYLFWKHNLLLGLMATIIPPVLISIILITFVNLNKYKSSRLGKYLKKHMSPLAQGARLLGFGVMSIGAWEQKQWLILMGLLLIIPAWGYGWVMYRLHLAQNK